VGVWDETGFDDVEALATRCRFADCEHRTEPGCAVRAALDPERIEAWRKLKREQAWIEDRRAAERERQAFGRRISREMRRRG
jgi:ribosome biogenesis GTPase / thiamine phosphate phosphatase